jgi:hypothetical protein
MRKTWKLLVGVAVVVGNKNALDERRASPRRLHFILT